MSDVNPGALPSGSIFHGRYEVVRCLRAGGMGAVYEVVHLETKRRRALKVMLPELTADPELRARFQLEATVAADIQSEHIVETFDAGVDEATGAPFLVMELLRGEDLSVLLDRRKRLPADEVVLLLAQVAHALDKTHAAGIIHRDLKPENLFVTYRDDGSPRLKVLDFGIAKVVAQRGTARATRTVGTPLYMSPEQVRGDGNIGPASDLYALGHIAYTLLVGEAYFVDEESRADSVYSMLLQVVAGVVEAASPRAYRRTGVELPPAFDAWLVRATAVVAAQRFGTARDMISALAEALGSGAPRMSLVGNAPAAKALEITGGGTVRLPQSAQVEAPGFQTSTATSVWSDRRSTEPGRSRKPVLMVVALTAVAALAAIGLWHWESGSADTASAAAAASSSAGAQVVPPSVPSAPSTASASAVPVATASATASATQAAAPAVRVAAPPPFTAAPKTAPPTAKPQATYDPSKDM